jgi:hypothetical protein
MRSGKRENIDDVKWPENKGCNGISTKRLSKNAKIFSNI